MFGSSSAARCESSSSGGREGRDEGQLWLEFQEDGHHERSDVQLFNVSMITKNESSCDEVVLKREERREGRGRRREVSLSSTFLPSPPRYKQLTLITPSSSSTLASSHSFPLIAVGLDELVEGRAEDEGGGVGD